MLLGVRWGCANCLGVWWWIFNWHFVLCCFFSCLLIGVVVCSFCVVVMLEYLLHVVCGMFVISGILGLLVAFYFG